ncbi:ABC transporter permease [Zeimonas arvi]|uniref:ABC transporter permease n=1 Tax=Zeimonas arvi TaxID=2498847 RepID=A0A5C8NUC8_9BURK|nr:ABC transporter permease [Zeimonas arvi]TXL64787.1 ABC transporter permease [Zeimonas arvi]
MNTAAVTAPAAGWPRLRRGISDALLARRGRLLALLLVPPMLWLGVLYLGSLLALLANSFFGLDEFTGQVSYDALTLKNFVDIFSPANRDVILRTVAMALAVTLACAAIGFPIAYFMARYTTGATKAACYILVMLPLWSSYLVRLYAWKLLLAREGAVNWVLGQLHLAWLVEGLLALPVVGGPSLSFSPLGTFLVFVYLWLPFMILPIQAAVERIPHTVIEASGDLGAHGGATFRHVILPMALPGVIAGSIFTFSLTLGDYIVPGVIGDSRLFIGQVVYMQQGVAGNVPFAAAFSLVPIAVIAVYLWLAKRKGAFDAL